MSGVDPVATLRARLAAMPRRLRAEANAALLQVGEDAVEAARRRLAQADGPRPSAPGSPPSDPAGRLAATLTVTPDEAAARVSISAGAPQAMFLEYGTRTMAPRPFIRPAIAETRPDAIAHCRQALARATGSDGGPR